LYLQEKNLDVFFITLNNSGKHFSPSTMYNDYAISERLFHWQSQSTTSASLYKRFHMKAEYVRTKGFEPLQQEQMIIAYVKKHGSIRRAEVADLCKISDDQAKRLLKSLSEIHEEFKMVGVRRGAHYVWEGRRE